VDLSAAHMLVPPDVAGVFENSQVKMQRPVRQAALAAQRDEILGPPGQQGGENL